jgi:predicted RNA binding protein YcfA (HicA-like mRNA interferase family)
VGGKYPLLKPNEIINALGKKGFYFKSQKGSHAKYTNGSRTTIIPIDALNGDVKKGRRRIIPPPARSLTLRGAWLILA